MAEKYTESFELLIFNPQGQMNAEGLPVWYCTAHSRRKSDPTQKLGQMVFSQVQFQQQHPDGFRNSMAATQACKTLVKKLFDNADLYYCEE